MIISKLVFNLFLIAVLVVLGILLIKKLKKSKETEEDLEKLIRELIGEEETGEQSKAADTPAHVEQAVEPELKEDISGIENVTAPFIKPDTEPIPETIPQSEPSSIAEPKPGPEPKLKPELKPRPEPKTKLAPVRQPVIIPTHPVEEDKQIITDRLKIKDVKAHDQASKMHEKAKRKARVIVREIQMYHKEKTEIALREKNLYKYLREEIDAGRKAYEREVPQEIRQNTNYYQESLITILAKGDKKLLGL
ncbi:hypothetical protein JXQ70_19140 [bacterium]|nr:hypothetical protein [bacterium]